MQDQKPQSRSAHLPRAQSSRRKNQLNGDYVLVSPHRLKRPWKGANDLKKQLLKHKSYDAHCPLCPGNQRNANAITPNYQGVYVFENDFPALTSSNTENSQLLVSEGSPLFQDEVVQGQCFVMCYSEDHSKTFADLNHDESLNVVNAWQNLSIELLQNYAWVQIFENKGEMMGCSQPHPHGQIWAQSVLPTEALKEQEHQLAYYQQHQNPLLLDYALQELDRQERLVFSNSHWVVIVPYWAQWPYETLVLPRWSCPNFGMMNTQQSNDLAFLLVQLTKLYDQLFDTPMPYTMGWHQSPGISTKENTQAAWQLHCHFYPPLLRSASVKKHMVGYEMLSESQRDITPEVAAEQLRNLYQQSS